MQQNIKVSPCLKDKMAEKRYNAILKLLNFSGLSFSMQEKKFTSHWHTLGVEKIGTKEEKGVNKSGSLLKL